MQQFKTNFWLQGWQGEQDNHPFRKDYFSTERGE